MRIGSAPDSWGVWFADDDAQPPWSQFLDEVAGAGYRWIELGPYGYLPTSPDELEDLVSVLSKADPRVPSNWSRRFKNHQEKLKSGDVYQVAEVVRNLALRDVSKGLSAGEKSMLNKARSVLVSELSFALDVSEEEALTRLEGALA